MKQPTAKPTETANGSNRIRAKEKSVLWILFAAMVLIHTGLAHALVQYPLVKIDEMLYSNIARSIVDKQRIMYMGQPADYVYLMYPLVLSPVYALLGYGANFYRVIQLLNAVLMSASVFPLYALAKSITGKHRSAVIACLLFAVLPDTMLSGYILSENLIYPLFFTAVYLIDRYIGERRTGTAALIGVICGLLYETKPGSAVPMLGFLGVAVYFAVKEKQPKQGLNALWGVLGFAGIFALGYLVTRYVFGLESSGLFAGYTVKIGSTESADMLPEQMLAFGKGILCSVYYILLSCGGMAILYPMMGFKGLDSRRKTMYWMTLGCLAVSIVGTAWVINRNEYMYFTVHMRYFAMYMPVLFIYLFVGGEKKKAGSKVPVIAGGALIALCTVLFGAQCGLNAKISRVSAFAVDLLRCVPDELRVAADILICALCAGGAALLIKKRDKGTEKLAVTVTFACLIVNSVAGLTLLSYPQAEAVSADVKNIQAAMEDHEVLGITQNRDIYMVKSGLMDVNTKRTTVYASINDLYNTLIANNGVYRPIKPEKYGITLYTEETPEVEYLLFDNKTARYVKFNGASEFLTDPEGTVSLVKIPKDARCADSIMGGLYDNCLYRHRGIIRNFREDAGVERLVLHMETNQPGSMTVSFGSVQITTDMPAGSNEYTVEANGDIVDFFIIDCPENDVTVNGYEIVYKD